MPPSQVRMPSTITSPALACPRKLRYCITITATMSTMAAFEPDACRMPQYASFQIS